jgi:hypothetical protein
MKIVVEDVWFEVGPWEAHAVEYGRIMWHYRIALADTGELLSTGRDLGTPRHVEARDALASLLAHALAAAGSYRYGEPDGFTTRASEIFYMIEDEICLALEDLQVEG